MDVFAFQSGVMMVASFAMLGVKVWALVDAIIRRPDAFVAADKLTKTSWVAILAIVAVLGVLFPAPIGLFSLVGIIAALVYLLDVRPALAELTRR